VRYGPRGPGREERTRIWKQEWNGERPPHAATASAQRRRKTKCHCDSCMPARPRSMEKQALRVEEF